MPSSENSALWYKDAIIYELHVKAFNDSNDDGIGDFKGLIKKLDYLESLGITAIWLLPFYPSPFRDDGYDISDFFSVHKNYGNMFDFKVFLKEARKRNLKVITELILNHTSDQHPWFQKARKEKPNSKYRNYYVWSDTAQKYQDARIIFKDFETSNWTWDSTANAYYWHRFYSHQPDLNYENPKLVKEVYKIIDYWFGLGVDGMRLDAIPYLFEKEGTNCENLPETYEFLKKIRSYVDKHHKNKMFLAEANQWPEDAAAYFGDGDACHMAYHFPLMPRMFMALQMEDRFPIFDILEQTPMTHPDNQWALFLRNHDELTLEMVTDEERDYMYKVYARDTQARINLGIRRRLAPLLSNNRRKIELMNFILFSLPGTPVIYYGDEIGMGDNYYLGDRNGVRTPMQWTADRNAGFSKASPQKLFLPVIIDPEYNFETVNVENQERNLSSLLWWMKRVMAMRKRYKAFGRGDITFLHPENQKILAFIRSYKGENILVVVNLSRFSQAVELDLTKFEGHTPVEVFGWNKFPVIGKKPYLLTMGFHGYFWFLLKKDKDSKYISSKSTIPIFNLSTPWHKFLYEKHKKSFESDLLLEFIKKQRWYGGKSMKAQKLEITEKIPLKNNNQTFIILIVQISFMDIDSHNYVVPVAFAEKTEADKIFNENPNAIILRTSSKIHGGILYDALHSKELHKLILSNLKLRKNIKTLHGICTFRPGKSLKQVKDATPLENSHLLKAEQSNSSILYDEKFILKIYRKIDEGINPDLEISRFITEKTNFKNIPCWAGNINYKSKSDETMVLGMLQTYESNEGDGWSFTLDSISRYFERVMAKKSHPQTILWSEKFLNEELDDTPSPLIQELIGGLYIEMASILGKRTAEMHSALSCIRTDHDFAPEEFSLLYQKSLYQSLNTHFRKVFSNLKKNINNIPKTLKHDASLILNHAKDISGIFQSINKKKISTMKTRIHGDYHLGQVLYTGNDFIIIDFEGEPARAISERRFKRTPFKDIAGMIRSFHYAAYTALKRQNLIEETKELEAWAYVWYFYVSKFFLQSYLEHSQGKSYIPKKHEEVDTLLKIFLLDKAIYELGYELNNRPDWLDIPVKAIMQLINISRTPIKPYNLESKGII